MVRKSLLLLILIFGVLVTLGLVSAATTLNLPIAGGNYSTTLIVNCTTTTSDCTGCLNASIYYNASGGTTGTYLDAITNNTNNDIEFYDTTIDISSLNDGTAYNFSCMADNATTQSWSIGVTSITIDNAVPNVSAINNPVDGGNYSGNLVLNASVDDSTMGVESVYFNITNSSGQINWTKATNSGIYYNFTLDTTSLGDGMYNITIYANDSLNNLNSSEKIQVTIDNTAPALSFSCSPSSVNQGGTVTCSCSGTDATSGINTSYGTSGYSFTSSPSTVSSGTFTLSCGAKDYAGNSRDATASYTVTEESSGRTSTVTTSTWTRTYTVSDQKFVEGYTKILSKKHRLKIKISEEDHYVGVTDITSTTVTISVSSTPQTATLSVGEEKKFEVTGDDFLDISVTLNSLKNNQADITIKSIYEKIPEEIQEELPEEIPAEVPTEEVSEEAPRNLLWLWILIIIIIIAVIVYIIYKKKPK